MRLNFNSVLILVQSAKEMVNSNRAAEHLCNDYHVSSQCVSKSRD